MDHKPQSRSSHPIIKPRIIIHGGAGNILPSNLSPSQYTAYTHALLRILSQSHAYLLSPPKSPDNRSRSALDAATYAVTLLENDPLFNSAKGAVFTRDGVNEMEASVMVSRGYKKRGVGVTGVRLVKNPILLAREMLVRGEDDLDGGNGEHRGPIMGEKEQEVHTMKSSGAQGHSQLFGGVNEELAKRWGVETVEDQSYFFSETRWKEHIAGLEREKEGGKATWDPEVHVSQGTCGAVVLDTDGVVCVATSTGGMTNKLTGRVGDTPTLGAGFWAEEWHENIEDVQDGASIIIPEVIRGSLADCFPGLSLYSRVTETDSRIDRSGGNQAGMARLRRMAKSGDFIVRSTAISGTGNGDSFLRVNACRTASAIAKYGRHPRATLRQGMRETVGPDGELQKSAENRWKKTGEGEGGMIGIELTVLCDLDGIIKDVATDVIADYNCGGMFRGYIDDNGKAVVIVWAEDGDDIIL